MRRTSLLLSLLSIAVTVLSLTSLSTAGIVETQLQEHLATVRADEPVRVLIRPMEFVKGLDLQQRMAASVRTRQGRHAAAMRELQSAADRSQPAIIADLARLGVTSKRIKTYWIDNFIEAELTAAQIAEIAARTDVDQVMASPSATLIEPIRKENPRPNYAAGASDILRVIGADQMWNMGYTGVGRLVASIDTGVEEGHPYLTGSWRGNNGHPAAESWFDPTYASSAPLNLGQAGSFGHGTMVMGLMVGHDESDGDTVGVAIDAQWISTGTIDVVNFQTEGPPSIVEAMQWLADPDGDPNTVGDVPDVVCNSWGVPTVGTGSVGCAEVFWNAIDNLEALGAAMIFAAGNEGGATVTIRNPANRQTSETNAFSVGMVINESPFTVHTLSSRGPSDCDLASVKPELVAPGVGNLTAFPGDTLTDDFLGTSFSTPLAAAAFALLRQARPNATVEQIKMAMLNGATDLGGPGNDNLYGYGLLNIPGALNLLPEDNAANIELYDASYNRPAPGANSSMSCVLRAMGSSVTNVGMTLTSLDPRLTFTNGTASFGAISKDGMANNSSQQYSFTVSEDTRPGERLNCRFEITADGGYNRSFDGVIQVGPQSNVTIYTHEAGNFRLSVADDGSFGRHIQSIAGKFGGEGYAYPKNSNVLSLFEGAFLVGTDADHISDVARGTLESTADFVTDPGGHLKVLTGAQAGDADEYTRCAFYDSWADNPLGLYIVQETYAYSDTTIDDFLTVRYTIHNQSDVAIDDLRAALFFDWDFPWGDGSSDWGGFEPNFDLGYMQHKVTTQNLFRGIAVLNRGGMTSYRYMDNDVEVYGPPAGDGITEADKAQWMSEGFQQTGPEAGFGDASHISSTGPFDLTPGDSVVVAFAIIGATTLEDLREYARRARFKYDPVFPAITLSTGAYQFYDHGEGTADAYLTIGNIGFEALDWDISNALSSSWLSVSQPSGSIADSLVRPIEITIQIDASGLADGDYTDTLVIASNDFNLQRRTIPVKLHKSVPGFATIQPVLSTFMTSPDVVPPMQKLAVHNLGSQDLIYLPSVPIENWLTVAPASGGIVSALADPDTLRFSVDPTGLEPGDYSDTISVSLIAGIESATWYIPVTLRVLMPAVLSVDVDSMYFTAEKGDTDPANQSLMIGNEGGQSMDWGLTGIGDWVSAFPTTGTLDPDEMDQVTVAASLGDLDSGIYLDTIYVTADDADGSPHIIPVVFQVTAPMQPEFDRVVSAPNPFTPGDEQAQFMGIPSGSDVLIRIYDLAGEEVATAHDGSVTDVPTWDGKTDDGDVVAEGVYLAYVQIRSGGEGLPRKQVLKVAVAK